ncbi:hypothetical protein BD779DRAFT_1476741 [Infundibulicybe gibba]|nr:hypothetical protein BD779DRAFT_1476741 [Infundibulicybe gibba]
MTNGCGPRADDTWARKYQACPIDDDSNDDWRPMGRQMSKRRPKNKQQLSANDVRMHKQANNRRCLCLACSGTSGSLYTLGTLFATSFDVRNDIPRRIEGFVARDLPGATLLTATRPIFVSHVQTHRGALGDPTLSQMRGRLVSILALRPQRCRVPPPLAARLIVQRMCSRLWIISS